MKEFMKKLGNWASMGLLIIVTAAMTIGLLTLAYYSILADLGYRWG